MKKILLFGSQKIAVDILHYLATSEKCRVVGVVASDNELDRMHYPLTLSEYCFSRRIPCVSFDKISSPQTKMIEEISPDLIVSAYYRKILPPGIIRVPTLGCINIHPSLLPRNRGPNPVYWVIRNGDKYTGSTLHYIDEGMDTGDIIDQRDLEVADMGGFSLSKRLMEVGLDIFKDNIEGVLCGTNKRFAQGNLYSSCNVLYNSTMRVVDWNQDVCKVIGNIKAHQKPYSGAIAKSRHGDVILWSAVKSENYNGRGPGTFNITADGLIVQTHTSPVLVKEFECLSRLPTNGRFL